MRNIIILIVSAFIMVSAQAVEKKEVCKDVKNKQGKVVKQCKMVKVHKKAEDATAVPKKQAPKKNNNKK